MWKTWGREGMDAADYMRRAIEIAYRGKGSVHPNPLVGCVLVRDGEIIAGVGMAILVVFMQSKLLLPMRKKGGSQLAGVLHMLHWSLVTTMEGLRPVLKHSFGLGSRR